MQKISEFKQKLIKCYKLTWNILYDTFCYTRYNNEESPIYCAYSYCESQILEQKKKRQKAGAKVFASPARSGSFSVKTQTTAVSIDTVYCTVG